MQLPTVTSPGHYRIDVVGNLGENWSITLGMKVTVALDANLRPITTLTGEVSDQAMLLGVLNYVNDLRMPIIMVKWLDRDA